MEVHDKMRIGWEYLGPCVHCNCAMYYDPDNDELRTTTDTDCMCELEEDYATN